MYRITCLVFEQRPTAQVALQGPALARSPFLMGKLDNCLSLVVDEVKVMYHSRYEFPEFASFVVICRKLLGAMPEEIGCWRLRGRFRRDGSRVKFSRLMLHLILQRRVRSFSGIFRTRT